MNKIEEEYYINEQTPATITDTDLILSSPTPTKPCLDGARCRIQQQDAELMFANSDVIVIIY